MDRKVQKLDVNFPAQPKLLNVAAYGRVSSGKDAMLHSLSAQVSYYSEMIQNHPGWNYCGVYADEAITGTKNNRENFQRLIADCRAGKIDMVITKSISRFARNTLTLLNTVREFKELGIDVFFEEQNIHTMSGDGELMLTILASYAQEESRSASENQKWRIKRNFENGQPWCGVMLGYRQEEGEFKVVPEEAAIVRRIYSEYLSGNGVEKIVNRLNKDGVLTRKGFAWHNSAVSRILTNYNYTGNLLLQRFYSENHITKKKLENCGEKPKYMVDNSHEPIISLETFERVQAEIERRADKYKHKSAPKEPYPFSRKIVCAKCGKHYRRKTTATGPVWICDTYNSKGKTFCASKAIPEVTLLQITDDIPFDEIIADDGNTLYVHYRDSETVLHWKDRSRSESWTAEMRKEAGTKTRQRRNKECQQPVL